MSYKKNQEHLSELLESVRKHATLKEFILRSEINREERSHNHSQLELLKEQYAQSREKLISSEQYIQLLGKSNSNYTEKYTIRTFTDYAPLPRPKIMNGLSKIDKQLDNLVYEIRKKQQKSISSNHW